jgi:hypothetical protein
MKDKQLKIEKIEASRTLGGARNAHTQKDFLKADMMMMIDDLLFFFVKI